MLKAAALIALSLLTINTAVAREIQFKKRYDKLWDTQGWSIYTHRVPRTGRPLLVLVNRITMQIEILDPKTGETLTQDSLNTKARNARLMETLVTSTGEFSIAFATDTRVELHTLSNPVSYEIPFHTSTPLALKLMERESGGIDLFVATERNVEVYRRTTEGLDQQPSQNVKAGRAFIETGLRGHVQGFRTATWKLFPATVKRVAMLSIFDQTPGSKRVDIPIGSAHRIDDVGGFVFNGTRQYFFVRDNAALAIQSENSGAVIPNKRAERIVGVRLVPSVRSLAVMLENDHGSRLLMIGLE